MNTVNDSCRTQVKTKRTCIDCGKGVVLKNRIKQKIIARKESIK